MKVCVFGAGAVGGHIAVRLATAGNDVSVIARGATAAALSERGLTLKSGGETLTARPRVCTDAAEAGQQDVVFVAVKSMSVPAATEAILRLRGENTSFAFIVNGIPWWFPHGARLARPLPDLDELDPNAHLAKGLGMERVIGSVVYSGNEMVEPGVIVNHSAGNNVVSVGDPGSAGAERVQHVSRLLEGAGFKSPIAADIRRAVWTKLLTSNLASFPICTLLEAPQAVFGRNPELARLGQAILEEGMAVARAYGIEPEVDPAKVYDPARMNSPHKPSMVQDLIKGRPLEIDGVLLAAQKFARAAGVPMPRFDALLAILVQRATDAGLYKPPH